MGKNKGEMKYHTLKELLKNDILSGVYQPGVRESTSTGI